MKIIRPITINSTGAWSRTSIGTYFDNTGSLITAGINEPRFNYDPITGEFQGLLIESSTRNWARATTTWTGSAHYLFESNNPAGTYTLSFYGSGTITMSGAATGSVVGLGDFPQRKVHTFTKITGDVTFSVTGTVQYVQIEEGSKATSYIPVITASDTGIRDADIVTDSGIIYSNISENDYAEWDAGVSYVVDDYVIRKTTHKVYKNAIAGVNTTFPENDVSGRWIEIGSTNLFSPFDQTMATSATKANEIIYVLKPGRLNGLALLGLDATSIDIAMISSTTGEVIYTASADLLTGATIGSWYQYFYEPIYTKDALIITQLLDTALMNLPAYSDCILTIRIKYPSQTVSVGAIVVGLTTDIGLTQYDASLGIIDYSSVNTDTFGRKTIVKRGFSKRSTVDLIVKNDQIDNVARILQIYRATPLVWVATENIYNSLVVYGIYKDWEIRFTEPKISRVNIQIEGLSQ